jgi:hypothetical protein
MRQDQDMGTGVKGAFVISWSQTETDGFAGAPAQDLRVGSTWAWTGELVRVDGPSDVLRLDMAEGADHTRRRAARMVRRLIGAAVSGETDPARCAVEDDMEDNSFVVTDGARSFTVTLIPAGPGRTPLAMFLDDPPPRGRDLWVVHHRLDTTARDRMSETDGGVICFTPGTRIDTPDGPRRVEELREGDYVQTKDNGPQEVLWRGSRRMTGARLFAMPRLRPIRIQASAFGSDLPDETFLVSPEHRMLLAGPAARALFNTDEVLVSAKHLLDRPGVEIDLTVKSVTYIHLLLPRHEVLWANGVETESFHPASTSLATLQDRDRARLLSGIPALESDPHVYGAYARRALNASEAALLRHAA